MISPPKTESCHGVFMRINKLGILIMGEAGSGKSSLALELLHQGHQLIADDCVEFQQHNDLVMGVCPSRLTGQLHQREIGLIDVAALFGDAAVTINAPLDIVLRLDPMYHPVVALHPEPAHITILGKSFPQLTLNPHNPAQLSHRLNSWIAMQSHQATHTFRFQQHAS